MTWKNFDSLVSSNEGTQDTVVQEDPDKLAREEARKKSEAYFALQDKVQAEKKAEKIAEKIAEKDENKQETAFEKRVREAVEMTEARILEQIQANAREEEERLKRFEKEKRINDEDTELKNALLGRKEERTKEALQHLLKSCVSGNSCSMFHLAKAFWEGGWGLEQDLELAAIWYKKGAGKNCCLS